MSINNYPFDVAFVRGVSALTREQICALESVGLAYYSDEYGTSEHLQVWCGCVKGFAAVPAYSIEFALSLEDKDIHHKLFFDTVEDLLLALS